MSSLAPWTDARDRLTAAALVPPASIAWPNEPFDKPQDGSIWLEVDMTGDTLAPLDIGANVWAEEGQLFVHVVVPAGSGSDAARAMAKNVANVFRNLGPANPTYYDAAIGLGSVEATDGAGAWWGLTVSIAWKYQDSTQI